MFFRRQVPIFLIKYYLQCAVRINKIKSFNLLIKILLQSKTVFATLSTLYIQIKSVSSLGVPTTHKAGKQ